jgi:hypothetical protein
MWLDDIGKYKNKEFCIAVDCNKLSKNKDKCNMSGCIKTAKEFHHCLNENHFCITKCIKTV